MHGARIQRHSHGRNDDIVHEIVELQPAKFAALIVMQDPDMDNELGNDGNVLTLR